MNLAEWPLILFTVLAQSAVGAFWWCTFALGGQRLAPDQIKRLERAMIIIWLTMGLAFAISSVHMGSPWRAINALFRLGQANLSNEVFFGSAFIGFGGLAWLLAWRNQGGLALRRLLHIAALVCSLVFLWNMAAFYRMPTVPTWDTLLTPSAFLLTTILGGSALASFLFALVDVGQINVLRRGPLLLSGIAVVAAIAVSLYQASALTAIYSSIHQATALPPAYGSLMAVRFVLLALALALCLRPVSCGKTLCAGRSFSAFALILFGEMIGRCLFYATYMTVGLL